MVSYVYPEWDILRELERRDRRVGRDKSKEVREWMRLNPDRVKEIAERRKG